MTSLPRVSVIIPAYNEEEYIQKTLAALTESDYPKNLFDIIVVDNNSSDRTASIAERHADKVFILKEGNVGAVRNLGAKHSEAEILVFLDADCIVDSNWLSRGVLELQNSKNTVLGGRYQVKKNANWIERLWILENPDHPRLQIDLLGGCIFIYASTFEMVGGFDERMTSGEDSELSQRLRNRGQTITISPPLSVVHLGTPGTIRSFLKRQIWHSENYITFIHRSIKDYTFWLTLTFMAGFCFSIYHLLSANLGPLFICVLVTAFIALLLSAKRILISKYKPRSLAEVLGIFSLDYLYLTGRSIGITKSLWNRIQTNT